MQFQATKKWAQLQGKHNSLLLPATQARHLTKAQNNIHTQGLDRMTKKSGTCEFNWDLMASNTKA